MAPERGASVTDGRQTGMLQHWREVKAQRSDAILFYRVGDFYEKKFSPGPQAIA